MSKTWRSWRAGRLGLAVAILSLTGAGARAAEDGGALRVRVRDAAGMAVQRAWMGARRRLADPACLQVLSDFTAESFRRPLSEVPALLGRSLEEHMDGLVFVDGSRRTACASTSTLAVTTVGDDTVHVCPTQFREATRSDPSRAEMVLIHEVLHTLGLGENPPRSLDITARVRERCGDS